MHAYIHTCIHTHIHTYIHTAYIHAKAAEQVHGPSTRFTHSTYFAYFTADTHARQSLHTRHGIFRNGGQALQEKPYYDYT